MATKTIDMTPAAIRAWALANGLNVGVRGVIATSVKTAYADSFKPVRKARAVKVSK